MSGTGQGGQTQLLGSCLYNGELFIMSISEQMNVAELYLKVSKKWVEITPHCTSIQYLALHHKIYVTLNTDEDVSNMIRLHMCLKLNIVDMMAVLKNELTASHIRRSQIEGDIGSTSGQNESIEQRNSIDNWSHCIQGEGQTFKDANEFRVRIKNYAIATRRSFVYKKNDSKKIILVCTKGNCKWRIYASRHEADKLFGIRKCNLEHTCGEANLKTRGHPRADSNWVANIVKDKLREEPSYRPCTMMKDIHREYDVDLGYYNVWMGKEIAMQDIHGADTGSYNRLRWYCNAVRQTNPGSIADYEVDPNTQKFRRLFLCFSACLVGFVSGCRPMLFLDGTHIKNKYKGCLFSVVAKDPNDDLFTVAYAVVDAEDDDNWEWFCLKLRSALDSHLAMGYGTFTFFSDRHSGLLKAIPIIFPGSHHAYCLRHLVDNFKKQVMKRYPMHNKKHWASVFMKAAYAPTRMEYNRYMDSILESMPLARDFIMQSEPQCWANSLFPRDRWGVINNNQAECWNSWVKPSHFMPVAAMVDHIRKEIMVMMCERRELSYKLTGELCPKQEKKLAAKYLASRTLRVDKSSGWSFEVVDNNSTFTVDLHCKTCSCRAWQVERMPCKHACACIESKSLSVYDFIDQFYRVEMYQHTYRAILNPIPTFDMHTFEQEEEPLINAPNVRCQPGRRKTQRIPSQVDIRLTKCRQCGRSGHNRRTCKEATTS